MSDIIPVTILALAMSFLAQMAPIDTSVWQPLIATGPLGVVLMWFMLRSEKKQVAQSAAIDRMTRAMLLLVTAPLTRCPLSSKVASEAEEAKRLLDELDKPTPQ